MNYRGSYRKLLGNSKSAVMAAIEIYNKPAFQYRDECFVILLLNAWELLLKALLSKNKASVFYQKKRNEPYRTLSWHDALSHAEKYFPLGIHFLPVRRNLELLGTYRDNAVHFYNAKGFSVLIYVLAQTSITNFRDIMAQAFNERLEDEITWQLLPIGIKPPVDPITYIKGTGDYIKGTYASAVCQFIAVLAEAVNEITEANQDSGRLLTIFQVKLESTKKISTADVIVGVEKASETVGPLTIFRTQDPNKTHPLRQKDVCMKIGSLHGIKLTSWGFRAITWKYNLKDNPQYCWRATEGILTRFSNETVSFIQRLSQIDFNTALSDYLSYFRSRPKKKAEIS